MINKEEKTTTTDEILNKEVLEEGTKEEVNTEKTMDEVTVEKADASETVETKVKKERGPLLSSLLIGIIDQLVVIPLSLIVLFLTDTLFRLFGYYIVDLVPAFIGAYALINILYPVICQVCKFEGSLGERILTK